MNNTEVELDLLDLEEIFEEMVNDQIDEDNLGVMVAYGGSYTGSPHPTCW
jgi:hypothetical protein